MKSDLHYNKRCLQYTCIQNTAKKKKNLLQINKNDRQSHQKISTNLKMSFTKQDVQRANKYIRSYTSLFTNMNVFTLM